MMEEEVPYDEMQHASDVIQELNEFRKAKQNCDFIIKVGSKEIHIHQNILCANSEYFKAMFTHDTLEKQSGCVELKDLDAECVIKCADFMYGRKIKISKEKWEPLMHAADMLQLHKLRKFLADFIESGLNVESFYKIKDFANIYNCEDLETKCDEFALENFEAISKLDGFKQITREYVSFLLESHQNEASGLLKMEKLIDWVRFDVEERGKLLPSMLSNLDLSEIPVQHRRHLLESMPLFSESFECHKILSASIMNDLGAIPIDLKMVGASNTAVSHAKAFTPQTQKIAVFDGTSQHLQCFDPVNHSWTQMHRIRNNMTKAVFSAITLDEHIYVLMESKEVHRLKYTAASASWKRISDMIDLHGKWPPVVTDGSCLYVAGTCSDELENSISTESYVPAINKWVKLSNEELPFNMGCAYLRKSIYCIGGWGDMNRVTRFDLTTKKWSYVTPMILGRESPSIITHFDKIYVFGGSSRYWIHGPECYDYHLDSWIKLCPSDPVSPFNLFVIQGSIFSVGGKQNNPGIMKYNIEDDEWSTVESHEQENMLSLSSVGLPSQASSV